MRSAPFFFVLLVVVGCKHTVGPAGEGEGEGSASEGEGEGGEGEGGCPSDPVIGLIVPVVDNCTQFHVCGATVIAHRAGVADETLPQTGSSTANCQYEGASDAPGTYEIDVTADLYNAFHLSNITVDQDACGHAAPKTVQVRLDPTAGCG